MNAIAQPNLLSRARSAMPGRTALAEAQQVLEERLATARRKFVVEDDVVDAMFANMLTGEALPENIGTEVAAVRRGNEAASFEVAALGRMTASARASRRDVQAQGADHGLRVVAGELADVLALAREAIDSLGPIDDAQAAIDAGPEAVAAWALLPPLLARYQQVREVQAVLVSDAMSPPDSPLVDSRATSQSRRLVAAFGTVENFYDWYPDGAPLPALGPQSQLQQARIVDGRVHFVTTTTTEAIDAPPWNTGDQVADLRWLCGPEPRPWVPSVSELKAAVKEHDQRRRAVHEAGIRT